MQIFDSTLITVRREAGSVAVAVAIGEKCIYLCIEGSSRKPCNDLQKKRMSQIFASMEERNDIVFYQSEDGLVRMEAIVDSVNETIWATQRAMAELFGVNSQAITRHIGNIYAEGELVKEATCSKMEQVRKEGFRTVSRKLVF